MFLNQPQLSIKNSSSMNKNKNDAKGKKKNT